jgi:hypothetical protein
VIVSFAEGESLSQIPGMNMASGGIFYPIANGLAAAGSKPAASRSARKSGFKGVQGNSPSGVNQ